MDNEVEVTVEDKVLDESESREYAKNESIPSETSEIELNSVEQMKSPSNKVDSSISPKRSRIPYILCIGFVIVIIIAGATLFSLLWLRGKDPCMLSTQKCGIFTDVTYASGTKLLYNSKLQLCSITSQKAGNMCQETEFATEVYFKPNSMADETEHEAICKMVASNSSDRNSTATPSNGTSTPDFQKKLFYRIKFQKDSKTVIAIDGSSSDKSGLTVLRSIFDVPLDVELTSTRTVQSLSIFGSKPDIYSESYSNEITVHYNTTIADNGEHVAKTTNASTNYVNELLFNETSKKIVSSTGSFMYHTLRGNSSSNTTTANTTATNTASSPAFPTSVQINSTLIGDEESYSSFLYDTLSNYDDWHDLYYEFTHINTPPSNSAYSNENETETQHRNLMDGFGSIAKIQTEKKLASTTIFGHEIGASVSIDGGVCIGTFQTCTATSTPAQLTVIATVILPRDKVASMRSAMSSSCRQNCNCYPDIVFNGGDGNADGPDPASYRNKLSFNVDLGTQSISGSVQSLSKPITVFERVDSKENFCNIPVAQIDGTTYYARVIEKIATSSANAFGVVVEVYMQPTIQAKSSICKLDFGFKLKLMYEAGKGRSMQILSVEHYDNMNYAIYVEGVVAYKHKTANSYDAYTYCPKPGPMISKSALPVYQIDCQCGTESNRLRLLFNFDLYYESNKVNVGKWDVNQGWPTLNTGSKELEAVEHIEQKKLQKDIFPPIHVNPNYGVCVPTPFGFCVDFSIGLFATATAEYDFKFIAATMKVGLNSGVYGSVGISIWIFSISVVAEGQLMNAVQEFSIAVVGWDKLLEPDSSLNSIRLCSYSYVYMQPISARAYLNACYLSICCCYWIFPYACQQCSQIGGSVVLIPPIGQVVKAKIWDNCLIEAQVIQPPLAVILAPTSVPTAAPYDDSSDSSVCFPSDATVNVWGKGNTKMVDLQYGDKVQAVDLFGRMVFNEVFLFGHRDDVPYFKYVNLALGSKTLTLSSTHFARICIHDCTLEGIKLNTYRLKNVYAKNVNVGDKMLTVDDDSSLSFHSVDMIWSSYAQGVHNPYILVADIVVNGVIVSVHSVRYTFNYFSLSVHTTYLVYAILGPKKTFELFEMLQLHRFTGSIRTNVIISFAVNIAILAPLIYSFYKMARRRNSSK